jgi:hypothetical protein
MDDLVMSVVNEVLQRKNTRDTGNTSPGKEDIKLNRPNYQRQNSGKRLMVYELSPDQTPEKEKVQNPMPELQIMRMEAAGSPGYAKQPLKPHSFGPVNETDFSCFSIEDNPNLKRLAGFPYSNGKAACVGMQEGCFINQVFAVDEILRQLPSLDFTVKWPGGRGEAFTFQAVGSADEMERVQTLLNQQCTCRKEIRLVSQPTAYLQKLLNYSADTIGTIEGVPYTKLLPQAADYFRKHPDSMLDCRIFGSYLLFGGQYSQVQAILQSMNF